MTYNKVALDHIFQSISVQKISNTHLEKGKVNFKTRGFLRKNIVAFSFFFKLCYAPIFLIHIFSIN